MISMVPLTYSGGILLVNPLDSVRNLSTRLVELLTAGQTAISHYSSVTLPSPKLRIHVVRSTADEPKKL